MRGAWVPRAPSASSRPSFIIDAKPRDRGEDAASSEGSGVLGEGAKVGLWRPRLKQEAGRAGPDTGRIADYAAPQGAPRTHTQPPAEVVRGHVLR